MSLKYRIVWLHGPSAIISSLLCLLVCVGITFLNPIMTRPDWVKDGENFVLFFGVLFAGLIYAFSVIEVFKTGQNVWKELVSAVKTAEVSGDDKEVERILGERPDYFLTVVAVLAWLVLVYCSLSLRIPALMLPLFFAVNLLLMLPVVLAFDYWGFEGGIKRVVKL
jgi:hypothetical protein